MTRIDPANLPVDRSLSAMEKRVHFSQSASPRGSDDPCLDCLIPVEVGSSLDQKRVSDLQRSIGAVRSMSCMIEQSNGNHVEGRRKQDLSCDCSSDASCPDPITLMEIVIGPADVVFGPGASYGYDCADPDSLYIADVGLCIGGGAFNPLQWLEQFHGPLSNASDYVFYSDYQTTILYGNCPYQNKFYYGQFYSDIAGSFASITGVADCLTRWKDGQINLFGFPTIGTHTRWSNMLVDWWSSQGSAQTEPPSETSTGEIARVVHDAPPQ